MDKFTQIVYVVGRVTPNGVEMLGTGFLVANDGVIVTTHHVTGSQAADLVILAPHIGKLNDYQDISDNTCRIVPAKLVGVDPIHDLSLLKADVSVTAKLPQLGSFDNASIGEEIAIFGFPHCVEGRRALTYQKAEIGAKVLLETSGIKSKHAVINVQARPGQSGSIVYSPKSDEISGVLVGAWVPSGAGISLGGINPRELHQTTHCVSAEYVRDML